MTAILTLRTGWAGEASSSLLPLLLALALLLGGAKLAGAFALRLGQPAALGGLRKLRTPEGRALLGAAVIDDILVILALALFAALWQGTGGLGVALLRLGG